MAIKHLTDEQVREWSLEQKDKWWAAEIFRGNMPQLTIRSAITGMMLGGILSLTNLYVGVRTGWTLGVGITSVILAFSLYKILSRIGLGKEFHILENVQMQSIATAAGYMTAPLISSLPAYMMVTGKVIPLWHTLPWIIVLGVLGVLFAFPLKRRFINEEQYPFPEGRAAGVVMDALHTSTGAKGILQGKLLAGWATLSAGINFIRDGEMLIFLKMQRLGEFMNTYWQHWDDFVYRFTTPSLLGTPLRDLTIRFDTEIVMVGAGGLMGIRTGVSLIIGAVINYFFLAPYLIQEGIITEVGFRGITMWSLWGGVAMMTTSSLFAFFSKPRAILAAFTSFRPKRDVEGKMAEDPLRDVELPMKVFVIGIPIVGALTVWMAHAFFDVSIWLGIIAIPLVFIFTLIAAHSTALTAITPTGALGKLTQLTYAALAPGNTPTNLMTAGITGEVASNASNLLMDIKPGYMLGAKPRHQAIGHVLGILAGGFVCTPIFYFALFRGNIDIFGTDRMPMIAAMIWKAVAEVLTQGFDILDPTALTAVVVGAFLGIIFEVLKITTHNRWPISGVGMGLAFVLRFSDAWAMFLGAFLFWVASKRWKDPASRGRQIFVDNQETICAGVIAGGALMGIVIMVLKVAVFGM
jgi:OPT family oligopeptide transporter